MFTWVLLAVLFSRVIFRKKGKINVKSICFQKIRASKKINSSPKHKNQYKLFSKSFKIGPNRDSMKAQKAIT
jgi:hypothetical protein